MSSAPEESLQLPSSDLRANFNSRLIQEVKKYPILYERRNHRDVGGVRSTWQSIGISLNASPKLCETRWTSLRQTYSRKCQNLFHRSQDSAQVKWQWYHEMEFVRPFILPRKRIKSSAPSYDVGEEEDGDFSDGAAFVPLEEAGPSMYPQAEYSNGTCTDPLVLMESHMETMCTTPETSLQDSNEMGTHMRVERNAGRTGCGCSRHSCGNCTEWDVTGKLVAASLKRLKQRNARYLKIKILRLICEAEEMEILQDN